MAKSAKHMGMNLTKEEHEKWHKEHKKITSEQHGELMKTMGISEAEDKEWHKTHGTPSTSIDNARSQVNPFAIGGGFLNYCVKQGWLLKVGKGRKTTYLATEKGKKELKKYGIEIMD